jgi:hypothetical protein
VISIRILTLALLPTVVCAQDYFEPIQSARSKLYTAQRQFTSIICNWSTGEVDFNLISKLQKSKNADAVMTTRWLIPNSNDRDWCEMHHGRLWTDAHYEDFILLLAVESSKLSVEFPDLKNLLAKIKSSGFDVLQAKRALDLAKAEHETFKTKSPAEDRALRLAYNRSYIKKHEDLFSCNQKPQTEIDLRQQFGPTVDQGQEGICYACAAASLIQASISRNFKQTCTVDPRYLVVTNSHFNPKKVSERLNSAKSAPAYQPNSSFYERGNLHETLAAAVHQKRVGTAPEPIKCKFDALKEKQAKLIKGPCSSDVKDRLQCNEREFFSDTISDSKEIDFTGFKPQTAEINRRGSFTASIRYRGDEIVDARDSCNFSNPEVKKRIQLMVAALCAGQPVGLALGDSGIEDSNDGGKTYKRNFNSDSGHALVVNRLYFDEDASTYFFEARNSWADGDSSNPHKSVSRIRPEELCRVDSMTLMRGPKDADPWGSDSLVSEPQNASSSTTTGH